MIRMRNLLTIAHARGAIPNEVGTTGGGGGGGGVYSESEEEQSPSIISPFQHLHPNSPNALPNARPRFPWPHDVSDLSLF